MKRRLLVLMLVVSLLSGCDGSGDRVLVGKYLYDTDVVPPGRYDVVVFKFPKEPVTDGTPKNYIKRLLGLPGEIIAIFFGRLFSFHHTASGIPEGISEKEWRDLTVNADYGPLDLWANPPKNHETAEKLWNLGHFKILTKPPPVMLALSRPVFDNDHQPKDLKGVVPDRWAAQAGSNWAAADGTGFKTNSTGNAEEYLRYRHILRPSDWPVLNALDREDKIKKIKADNHRPQLITDFLGYNTYEVPGHHALSCNWVGDLMLTCKLTVEQPRGEFRMEVCKGVDRFQARFDLASGQCSLYRNSEHKTKTIVENGQNKSILDWQLLASAETRVKAKGDYALRFANYDDRLTVWVDRDLPFEHGKSYAAPAQVGPDTKDVDAATSLDLIENNDLQPASFCSVSAAVQVHNIKLWRDTYYTGFDPHVRDQILVCDHSPEILGDDWKLPQKWDPLHKLQPRTIYVYPGHFLCLGDNSQESSDSRAWGLVPERLMLGRALMVYFPFDRAGIIK